MKHWKTEEEVICSIEKCRKEHRKNSGMAERLRADALRIFANPRSSLSEVERARIMLDDSRRYYKKAQSLLNRVEKLQIILRSIETPVLLPELDGSIVEADAR